MERVLIRLLGGKGVARAAATLLTSTMTSEKSSCEAHPSLSLHLDDVSRPNHSYAQP